jgi:hypothetical protein
MCRGEFIITGEESGREVAGDPGLGLIMAPVESVSKLLDFVAEAYPFKQIS